MKVLNTNIKKLMAHWLPSNTLMETWTWMNTIITVYMILVPCVDHS